MLKFDVMVLIWGVDTPPNVLIFNGQPNLEYAVHVIIALTEESGFSPPE